MLDSCEFVAKKILNPIHFTFLYSVVNVSKLAANDKNYNLAVDPLYNTYCCSLCQNMPNCTSFENWRSNDTCNLFKNNIQISDLRSSIGSLIATKSITFAGMRFSAMNIS